jgi:Protein of unknown function (DUF2442)
VTIRSRVDCLIAACALRHGLVIFHHDRDFSLLAQVSPLRELRLELPMFLHVLEARYLRGYIVWLRFNDGASGEVDLSGELDGTLFGPLRGLEQFKSLTVAHHTLAWENGADFAPEFLREHVQVAAA